MHEIFNLEKIYSAYLACRKGKRKTMDALKFEWNEEKNLLSLEEELLSKAYRPGRSICFVVTEPVIREIIAGSFRDRIVQHLLVREVESIGESKFIFDSYSCRRGKGTHFGVERLKKFIAKNHSASGYFAKLDVSGFFMSIDHGILYSLFEKLIIKSKKSPGWKSEIMWLAKTIIFYDPTENFVAKGDLSLF